jgi:D-beta-D-heptose 7-phosphate kinase/D-beta-D-heptose 1-phosphate adenosyltransferase
MKNPKLISKPTATAFAVKYRHLGKRVVFTNGCFDVIHAGHIYILQEAAKFGDALILGLNDDDGVRRLKGAGRPKFPLTIRAYTLAALSAVDYIVPFSEDTPIELILAIKPDVLVKGSDYTIDTIVGAPEVESWGGRVEIVPLLEGISTTGILGV